MRLGSEEEDGGKKIELILKVSCGGTRLARLAAADCSLPARPCVLQGRKPRAGAIRQQGKLRSRALYSAASRCRLRRSWFSMSKERTLVSSPRPTSSTFRCSGKPSALILKFAPPRLPRAAWRTAFSTCRADRERPG